MEKNPDRMKYMRKQIERYCEMIRAIQEEIKALQHELGEDIPEVIKPAIRQLDLED